MARDSPSTMDETDLDDVSNVQMTILISGDRINASMSRVARDASNVALAHSHMSVSTSHSHLWPFKQWSSSRETHPVTSILPSFHAIILAGASQIIKEKWDRLLSRPTRTAKKI
jgi:hypothetical protein